MTLSSVSGVSGVSGVIEDCFKYSDEEERKIWLGALSSTLLSLFGSTVILWCYFKFGRGRGLSVFVVCIGLSDYFWAWNRIFTYFVTYADFISWNTDFVCYLNRVLYQIFAGSSVFWSASISLYMFLVLRRADSYQYSPSIDAEFHKYWKYFCLFCLGVPIFFVCVLLSLNNPFRRIHGVCYPTPVYHLTFWFTPLIAVYLSSIVIYVHIFIRAQANQFKVFVKHGLPFKISLYVLVFMVCWTVDITAFWIGYYHRCIPYELFMFINTTLNLQGFLDFLVYGFTNPGMKKYLSSLHWWNYLFLPILPFLVWVKAFPVFLLKHCRLFTIHNELEWDLD